MSESEGAPGGAEDEKQVEHVSAMRRLLDNPFALLFLGVTVPAVFYLIWGIMEIAQIPIAK